MVDDDDRELDIESEEDDELQEYLVSHGGGSHSSSLLQGSKSKKRGERGGSQVLDKRAHHNALERKRRDHIKDSFTGLRDAIPIMAGDKSSRAQILKKASDYISYMRNKTQTHTEDIDDLKRQNMHLEEQIRALERAKNMGHLATSDSVLANAGLKTLPSNNSSSNVSFEGSSSTSSSSEISVPSGRRGVQNLVVTLPSSVNEGPTTLITTSKISPQTRRIIVPGQSLLIPKDNLPKDKVKVQL
ncbi:MAX [Lepeophtheirus salmonis]|nr:MAX [Lepeophtheirus salmonis]CAF2992578.1 MAX [Lepeophtheirus salmonis]